MPWFHLVTWLGHWAYVSGQRGSFRRAGQNVQRTRKCVPVTLVTNQPWPAVWPGLTLLLKRLHFLPYRITICFQGSPEGDCERKDVRFPLSCCREQDVTSSQIHNRWSTRNTFRAPHEGGVVLGALFLVMNDISRLCSELQNKKTGNIHWHQSHGIGTSKAPCWTCQRSLEYQSLKVLWNTSAWNTQWGKLLTHLPSLSDLLIKDAVFVPYAIPIGCEPQCSHGIQEAG